MGAAGAQPGVFAGLVPCMGGGGGLTGEESRY